MNKVLQKGFLKDGNFFVLLDIGHKTSTKIVFKNSSFYPENKENDMSCNNVFSEILGNLFKVYRENKELSLESLADESGVSLELLAGFESGKGEIPDLALMKKLVQIYCLSRHERNVAVGIYTFCIKDIRH